MSVFEIIALSLGWTGIAFVLGSLWHGFLRKQPRARHAAPSPEGAPPQPCGCSVCRDLTLTPRHLTEIQVGVLLVGTGASRVVALGLDYLNEKGPGRVAITISDGALFEQVVAPAVKAHLAATRTT